MTIGKVTVRWLCLILLCALLVSCSEKKDFPFEAILSTEDHGDASQTGDYRVVVASDCSAELMMAARAFALRLTETLSVSVDVVYDRETDLPGDPVTEIVLGVADRPGVRSLMRTMRKDDYCCSFLEGRLVIGGVNETATLTALERFCQEILPGATASSLMHPDGGFSYAGTYPKAQVLLNGFELNEYSLVLPDTAPPALRALAEALQERIGEASGYWLRIVKQSADDGIGKRLALRQESEDSLAHITPTEGGLLLSAKSLYGVSVAVRELYVALLAHESEGVCDCRIESPHAVSYQQTVYQVATVLGEHWLPLANPTSVAELVGPVLDIGADAVLFGAVAPTDRSYLSANLPGYTPVDTALSGERVMALYGSDGCVSLMEERVGALSISAVRLGSETDGIVLVYVSGRVEEDQSLVLPDSVRETELPVALVTHVARDSGDLSFDDSVSLGLALFFEREYEAFEEEYAFACYASVGALQITPGTVHARGGCVSFSVARNTVFD